MFFEHQNPRFNGKTDSTERARDRASLEIADLEPRILLSATWIDPSQLDEPQADEPAMETSNRGSDSGRATDAEALLMALLEGGADEPGVAEEATSIEGSDTSTTSETDTGTSGSEQDLSVETLPPVSTSPVLDGRSVIDLVLIDSRLDDASLLRAGISSDAFVLEWGQAEETAEDVLRRTATWLEAGDYSLGSLSILSHGVEGAFQLGDEWVTSESVKSDPEVWGGLAAYLEDDAEIFLFGCDVATGEQGVQLLRALSLATTAEVYASDDVTGEGGDWTLEIGSSSESTASDSEIDRLFDLELLDSTQVSLAWYDLDWSNRIAVTVSANLLEGASNLSTYSVLVDITETALRSTSNGGRVGQIDGGDLLFTLSDGTTKISHQIEQYDAATGRLRAWVNLPVLNATTSTSLYLYYGNETVADQSASAAVWDSSHVGVWHLSNNSFADSTGNQSTGVNTGTTSVTGVIDEGRNFNGSSSISVASSASLGLTETMTFSAWIRPTAVNGFRTILNKGHNFWFGLDDGKLELGWGDYKGWEGGTIAANHWYHVAATFDNPSNTLRLYVNGVQVYSNTGITDAIGVVADNLTIGKSIWGEFFAGDIDEVRIRNVVASAEEILSDYRIGTAPSSYLAVGTEEFSPPVITSGGGGTNASYTVAENQSTVATVQASGPSIVYSIVTGNDSGRFQINSSTGVITFVTTPDFENPVDGDLNNVYRLRVAATNAWGSDEQIIDVTVTNVNEQPNAVADSGTSVEAGGVGNGTAGTNPSGNVLANDTDVDAGDTKTVTGVAAGIVASASGLVGSSVSGTFGSIVLNADGSYTYTVNNNNASVQALRTSGNTLTDTFTYTMRDAAGLTSTTQLTVTIQGANDAPYEITGTLTVAENAANGTVVGTVLGYDLDAGDTLSFSLVDNAGGRFAISSAGLVTVANGSLLNFEANTSHSITVRVTDAAGATFDKVLTVNLTNINEVPVAVSDTAIAVEAGGIGNGTSGADATGNVLTNDTDVDAGDMKTVIGVAAGVVASSEGSVSSVVNGGYGSITLHADGTYTYVIDESNAVVQALRTNGQTLSDTFSYTMRDTAGLESTTQLVITIRGANDAPAATADIAEAIEAGGVENGTSGTNATGNVLTNDTDVDAGDTQTVIGVAAGVVASSVGSVSSVVNGTYGSITLHADGSYFYSIDEANPVVQALRSFGETLTDTFTYTMLDEGGLASTATVTITIHGTNDAPDALSSSGLSILENSVGGTEVGVVWANDVDAGETLSYSLLDDAAGRFTIDGATGVVRVASNALLDFEASTEHEITVRVTDAAGAIFDRAFLVQVFDGNEGPTAIADAATAREAGGVANSLGGMTASGNVLSNDLDPDVGESHEVLGVSAGVVASVSGGVGISIQGDYGAIQIATDGGFSYSLDDTNPVVQALRSLGETITDTFSYTMRDSGGFLSTTTISITIQGANDAPVATGDVAESIEAGGISNGTLGTSATGNVLTNDTDVDAGDTQTVIGVAAGVVSSSVGSVSSMVTGAYGSITLRADGTYTYVIDETNPQVQALRLSSETLSDTFSYTMRDTAGLESTAQLVITIRGANDAPVATGDVAEAIEAGGISNGTSGTSATGNVLTNDTDVDAGDTQTVIGVAAGVVSSSVGSVSSMVTGAYGSITLHADGTYTYVIDEANAAVQALRLSSETLSDIFSYTMRDTAGLESTTQLVITIRGANDAPVADALSFVTHEDVNELTAELTSSDVDQGDLAEYTLIQGPTSGTLQLDPDGTFRFTPGAAFQDLALGESRQVTFRYRVTDQLRASDEQWVSLEVTGRNDSISVLDDFASAGEGASLTVDVLGNDLDIDAGDLISLTGARLVQGVGALSWGGGGITFTPDPAYQALAPGESTVIRIEYDVVDLLGIQVTGYLEVTLLGERDQLQVSVSDAIIREDGIAAIPISIARIDTHGEQVVSVRLSGLPAGAMLQDGGSRVHVAVGTEAVELMGWDLATLQVRPPASFSGSIALQVAVTSDALGDAIRMVQWSIEIEPVADAVVLHLESVEGLRGDWIPVGIRADLADSDGSESLQLRLRGVPKGAMLTDGVRLWTSPGNDEWLALQSWSLSELAIRVMSHGGPIVPLLWEATTTELANGDRFVTTGVQEVVTIDLPPFAFVNSNSPAEQVEVLPISEAVEVGLPSVREGGLSETMVGELHDGRRIPVTSFGEEDPEGLGALDRLKDELDELEMQQLGSRKNQELEFDVERLVRRLLEWEGDARFERLHEEGLLKQTSSSDPTDAQWEHLQSVHRKMLDQAGVTSEFSWFWGWLRTLGVVRERDEMRQRIREEQGERWRM